MGPHGRTPGCRAGKRMFKLGKSIHFRSKTGHASPFHIAPAGKRQRRAVWGPNARRLSNPHTYFGGDQIT